MGEGVQNNKTARKPGPLKSFNTLWYMSGQKMAWVRYLECTLAMVKEEPAELAGTGSTGGIYHYEPNTLYSTDIE